MFHVVAVYSVLVCVRHCLAMNTVSCQNQEVRLCLGDSTALLSLPLKTAQSLYCWQWMNVCQLALTWADSGSAVCAKKVVLFLKFESLKDDD